MSAGEVLLGEAQRAIARQEAGVDGVRERAGRLLGTAAVIAGLFAVATQQTGDAQTRAKIGAFALFFVLALVVLIIEWPRTFEFERDITENLAHTAEWLQSDDPNSAEAMALAIANGLNQSNLHNDAKLKLLVRLYTFGIVLVLGQVLLWAIAVT